MATFTGAQLQLQQAVQNGRARVRVRFTQDPLEASPAGAHDALNPANWAISGPEVNYVASVDVVANDPQAVDLNLAVQLYNGAHVVSVANVQTAPGDPLDGLTAVTFLADTAFVEPVGMGAESDTAADVLRKHLNPALKGPAWDALIAAIATGDQANWANARLAFDQLFLSTASGLYLTRKAADQGIEKPVNVGIQDPLFRAYAIQRSTGGLTEESLLQVLEIFYGADAVRAFDQTGLAEPYALNDGDDLTVLLDERLSVYTVFQTADFAGIGVARAAEVAAALTRSFRTAGSTAYALALVDPVDGLTKVRVYSGALGLSSAVRVTGGKAQNALQFERNLALASGLPTWTVTVNVAAGTTRYAATNLVDLSQLRVGDYVNVYGDAFLAANQGSYPVTNVFYAYPLGTLLQYFEVAHTGAAQGPFVQSGAGDVHYFRPVRRTVYTEADRAVVVASLNNEVDVVLPATSQAVQRQAPHAAYAQGAAPLATVSSLVRLSTGVVTVHAPAHGLSIGDQIFVDGAVGNYALPATDPGDGATTTDACNVAVSAQLAAMAKETQHHASVLARDGRVFVTGGQDGGFTYLADVHIFHVTGSAVLADGATQYTYQWDGANPMNHAVQWHTLTALPNGQLLKAGGDDGAAGTNVCELCDITAGGGSGGWTVTGALTVGRYLHTATLLPNGKVLVTGGVNVATGVPTTTCELYNPLTGTWTTTGALTTARKEHTATLLPNGLVLVAGGVGTGAALLNSCELYDPVATTWSATGAMTRTRQDHAAVLLPSGSVLAVAGTGADPTNESPAGLAACELYDPPAGRWRPGPSMIAARDEVQAVLVPAVNKVYALGNGLTSVEYLDLDRMLWHTSSAALTTDRTRTTLTLLPASGTVLVAGGARQGFGAEAVDFLLSLPTELACAGGLNGPQTVLAVPDANHFTYQTPVHAYTAAAFAFSTPTVTPVAAPAADPGMPGPYVYDPAAGLAVTAVVTYTTAPLAKGEQYGQVDVGDATQFPDAPGWLAFDFSYADQQGPVRYLGRLSATALALDFGYRFTRTVPEGASVTYLAMKGGFVPAEPEAVGSFYVTASPAGRVAAQAALAAAVGAGIPLHETIVYPGDRGLAGEGLPAHGVPKLSDKVAVWAGDAIDAEVQAARED